jgi:hypothetical protein
MIKKTIIIRLRVKVMNDSTQEKTEKARELLSRNPGLKKSRVA